ncbi:MAG: S9 family peptidase, partial [Gemmatimonadales bacterium]|nr:S9 family peptidase [Gemmatimonadales bacterium]
MFIWRSWVNVALLLSLGLPAEAQRKVELDDLKRLREVSDPQVSPEGKWVAYTVTVTDTMEDAADSDLWMTSWDGAHSRRLTWTKEREHSPRWSPDGRYLAFLSAREDHREMEQVWLLDRAGGEAQRITDLPGGVSDLAWAPESRRLALIAGDPDPTLPEKGEDSTEKKPQPIVVDRFQFKEDETGYFDQRRDHLYLFDLRTRRAAIVTPGPYDEAAPAWSPDGRSIAFVSRRRPQFDRTDNYDLYVVELTPGATPRQLTSFEGPDMSPDWGSRPPAWSPDGKLIAYVQGGKPERIYYAGQKLAVVPAAGGAARVLTESLDRNVLSPTWTADGSSVLFLLEDERVYHLARVAVQGGTVERLIEGRQAISDISASAGGKLAVAVSTPARPTEVFAVEGRELRQLSAQNHAWLARVRLAPVEEISFKSRDGTVIHGFMVKPPDYRPGQRYPTILRIHGGPVWQYYNDFSNFDWQVLAAHGYVVVGANPRGSSGRGEKFSSAIWAAWGQKDGEDVLAAVDHLVARG